MFSNEIPDLYHLTLVKGNNHRPIHGMKSQNKANRLATEINIDIKLGQMRS